MHAVRRQVKADWLVSAWVWGLVLVVIVPTRVDSDLWGHLRFGLDWLATRSLSYHDPYSFTQDRPWINHEWLSEVQMALAYRAGGVLGLMLLKFCLLSLSLGLLARSLGELPVLVRSGCLLLATWSAVAPIGLTVRPHLWSWLFIILVAHLLLSPPSRRLLIGLPLIFAVWINLHGGVVVGGALVAVWAAWHVWTMPESRWLPLVTALASGAATLANPYGVRMWQFLAATVRIGRDIQEWRPIWVSRPEGWALPWVAAVLLVVAVALSKARPRADRLAVMLVFGCASARTMRLVPFFVVISIIYAIPSLRALTSRGWSAWKMEAPSQGVAVVSLIPVLLVVPIHRDVWRSNSRCMTIQGEWAPDRAVGAALRAASPHGRLVTTFGWGEFSIWHFGPALRVSFDGRRETVYTDQTDQRRVAIERGLPAGLRFLDEVRPEYIWLTRSSVEVRHWLDQQADYRVDLETPSSFLGVRRDQPVVTQVSAVPAACFPG